VENGAHITAYDPAVITFKQSNVDMAASALDATESADLLIVLTDWSEFKLVDPIKVASRMAHARVLDTRHLIDADAYTNAGFAAYVVGIGLIAE
jgi:UDPglucose 6-dehydrogenase